MTSLLRFLLFSSLLFWCGLVFAGTGRIVHIYELRHANPGTVLPVVKNLLETGETVESLGQQLIVHAIAENQKKIAQLLDQIDVPKPSLMVEVKHLRTGMNNAVRAGPSISNPGRASTHLGNSRTAVTQRIFVRDGEKAFIVNGEDIPYASELAMSSGRHQGFYRQTDYKKIRTGFLVRPTLLGKTVDIEIIPFREKTRKQVSPNIDNPPIIDYQQTATRIRVPLNSWFDIGGTASNREQDDQDTIRWSTGRNVQDRSIWIRIQVPSSQQAIN